MKEHERSCEDRLIVEKMMTLEVEMPQWKKDIRQAEARADQILAQATGDDEDWDADLEAAPAVPYDPQIRKKEVEGGVYYNPQGTPVTLQFSITSFLFYFSTLSRLTSVLEFVFKPLSFLFQGCPDRRRESTEGM